MCPTALVLASPYEGEDDDFVVSICTNRAVLDVGLLSLHDLRADSLIRPIDSRSVIQLLSNHCHFNNTLPYLMIPYDDSDRRIQLVPP